jgi:thiol-disulfide isomerase/thioredoxin
VTTQPEASGQRAESSSFSIPSLTDSVSGSISLDDYSGQVVLLDFWATWCPPCRYELPALNKLYAELKGQGFTLIGMTVDKGDVATVAPKVSSFELNYPVGLAGADVQAMYGGIRAVPTKILLDRTGAVQETLVGVVPEEELRAKIEQLLAN